MKLLRKPNQLMVCSVSIAEIYVKQMLGKLQLKSPIEVLVPNFGFRSLDFSFEMAMELPSLSGLVGHDPFDRMIAATARATGSKLITSDRALLSLGFDWILDSFD
jgi:PIN domain nuclease of toxin-antitoxin system